MSDGKDDYELTDLLAEAARARELLRGDPAFMVELRSLISQTYLTHTLFALWDSGFDAYLREHPRFVPSEAAEALGYDEAVFGCLLEYLVGRGLLRPAGDALELTERGEKYALVNARGLLMLYWGGYRPIIGQLGPMLRGEIPIGDPRLARSTRHAALGTEQINSLVVTPGVLDIIHELAEKGVEGVLDLGSGTGGFLIQFARQEPTLRGVGVDMSEAAVEQARRTAAAHGLEDRLTFHVGEVGAGPLPLPDDAVESVDLITAMFMLHEFGRHGPDAIVAVLEALREQFPGTLLLFIEAPLADVEALGANPPPHYAALDYLFIHPLSGQGRPLPPEEWERIVRQAGCEFVEHRHVAKTPVNAYLARL